jgi:hypothetical protein
MMMEVPVRLQLRARVRLGAGDDGAPLCECVGPPSGFAVAPPSCHCLTGCSSRHSAAVSHAYATRKDHSVMPSVLLVVRNPNGLDSEAGFCCF